MGMKIEMGRVQEISPFLVWIGIRCLSQMTQHSEREMAESRSPTRASRWWVSKGTKASSRSENCCDFNPHFPSMMQNLPLFCAGCPGSLRVWIWLRKVKVRSRSCSQPQSPTWKKIFHTYNAILGKISQNWSKIERSFSLTLLSLLPHLCSQ